MKFEYAIFDMDGTLLDSMHLWRNSLLAYIEEKNGTFDFDANFTAEYLNLSLNEGIAEYKRLSGDETPAAEIKEYSRNYVLKGYEQGQPLKPGALRLLDALQKQNTKMAILTATPAEMAKVALETSGLDKYFPILVSSASMNMSKGKPEVFEYTIEKLGAEKKDFPQILMFEDALYSIKTANTLGLRTVGLSDEFNKLKVEEIKLTAREFYATLDDFCNTYGL